MPGTLFAYVFGEFVACLVILSPGCAGCRAQASLAPHRWPRERSVVNVVTQSVRPDTRMMSGILSPNEFAHGVRPSRHNAVVQFYRQMLTSGLRNG
jgi:hypothetical protein